MALSFKKLFKKDESETNAVLTQEAKAEETQAAMKSAEGQTTEKKKGNTVSPVFVVVRALNTAVDALIQSGSRKHFLFLAQSAFSH